MATIGPVTVSDFNGNPTYKTTEQALAFGAADTVKSFTIDAEAKVHSIVVHHPVFTNAVTLTVSIENVDGREIYASDAIANPVAAAVENIQDMGAFVALNGVCTVKYTLSGAPGGTGGTVNTSVVLER